MQRTLEILRRTTASILHIDDDTSHLHQLTQSILSLQTEQPSLKVADRVAILPLSLLHRDHGSSTSASTSLAWTLDRILNSTYIQKGFLRLVSISGHHPCSALAGLHTLLRDERVQSVRVSRQSRACSSGLEVAELLVHSEVDFALSPSSSISLFGSAWWVAKEAEKLAIRARQAAEN